MLCAPVSLGLTACQDETVIQSHMQTRDGPACLTCTELFPDMPQLILQYIGPRVPGMLAYISLIEWCSTLTMVVLNLGGLVARKRCSYRHLNITSHLLTIVPTQNSLSRTCSEDHRRNLASGYTRLESLFL